MIDAAGRIVTPGLASAATQLGLVEVATVSTTRDGAGSDEAGAAFDVSRALNGNSALIALARADGLTEALSFPDVSPRLPVSGLAALIRLRPGADVLDRARAALAVTVGGARDKRGPSRGVQWQLLRAALDHARAAKAGVPDGDDAAFDDVLAGRMPLAIFTNRESDIREAAKLAADYHIHPVIVGGAEAWRAADLLAEAHIPVVLDPEADLPDSFDTLGNRRESAALLARAGVRVAFGLSGGPIELSYNAGLMLREGAGIAVANGLPYADALKAITVTPRLIWSAGSGTLAAGERADLVLWDGDPLEPSTNAVTVMIDGQVVSTDNRQRALELRYLPLAGMRKP